MIGLDTDVVVRYLVQDDPGQAAQASAVVDALTETEPGFLSLVTMVELHWVLRTAYRLDSRHCAELFEGLLAARELRIGQSDVVRSALAAGAGGLDFADAVIAELGREAGCRTTLTFDRRAARADGMTPIG